MEESEGMPGTRTAYGPDFYVAYLRDPDGHKLACVFSIILLKPIRSQTKNSHKRSFLNYV
jgi:hypothetical protein